MTEQSILRARLALAVLCLAGAPVLAQPSFGNPSPTAGTSTSQQANAAADVAAYKEVEYTNKARRGPARRSHGAAGLTWMILPASGSGEWRSGRRTV